MHGIVVVGVTRDHAEVWTLDERQRVPIANIKRHDESADHRHVKTGQFAHGHSSSEGFTAYFDDLASVIDGATEVMIAGHGTGKASAMEAFAEHLQRHHPTVFAKVSEMRYLDLPHTTGSALAALARKWKREQAVTGRHAE